MTTTHRPKAVPTSWLDKLVQAIVEGDADAAMHLLEDMYGEDALFCARVARMRLERRAA